MIANLANAQVFLNYPFDEAFQPFEDAMHFAVFAGGLFPICGKLISSPDRPRLEMLVDSIVGCSYSAHDFSRSTGEGENNLARFNMPLEMGMALFHALYTRRTGHRCSFYVPDPHSYKTYASDLAGLDPKCYNDDPVQLLTGMYDWLRDVVPHGYFKSNSTVEVKQRFEDYKEHLNQLKGSGEGDKPTFLERREVMLIVCEEVSWWNWRSHDIGKAIGHHFLLRGRQKKI